MELREGAASTPQLLGVSNSSNSGSKGTGPNGSALPRVWQVSPRCFQERAFGSALGQFLAASERRHSRAEPPLEPVRNPRFHAPNDIQSANRFRIQPADSAAFGGTAVWRYCIPWMRHLRRAPRQMSERGRPPEYL